jgi:phosphoadenosine phosphosulfate reductase
MSSSFGAESAALIHLAVSTLPRIRVVLVDTNFLFPETHAFVDALRRRFDLNLLIYRPQQGGESFLHQVGELDPAIRCDVTRCCAANKNEPFERAMRELRPTAWLRGIRRDQAETRRGRRVIEWSQRFNCYAISPLLNWSAEQIRTYLAQHDLPAHPLVAKGYTSIGCHPETCTRPIQIAEHTRAGRWSDSSKTECGLHL